MRVLVEESSPRNLIRSRLSEGLKELNVSIKGGCSVEQGFLSQMEKIEMLLDLDQHRFGDCGSRNMNVPVIKIGIKMPESGPSISLQKDESILVLKVVDRFIQFDCHMAAAGCPAIGFDIEIIEGGACSCSMDGKQEDDRSPRKRSKTHANLLFVALLDQIECVLISSDHILEEGLVLDLANRDVSPF